MLIRLPGGTEVRKSHIWTRLKLAAFGEADLGCHEGKRFYLIECDAHGILVDYERGYEGRLGCPLCALR